MSYFRSADMMLRMTQANRSGARTHRWAMLLLSLAGFAFLAGNGGGAHSGPVAGSPWALPLATGGALQMVWVPPGSFTMGSPATEQGLRARDYIRASDSPTFSTGTGETIQVDKARYTDIIIMTLSGRTTLLICVDPSPGLRVLNWLILPAQS
ncbi:MAG: hypothetical protein ABSA32_05985 [Candidatus Acidiferrales bacterium]